MGPLGCAEEYVVEIRDRDGRAAYGTVEPSALSWGRILDDTSEAQITVPYSGPDCCGVLGATRSWCNSAAIFRDGALVWDGPIVRMEYTDDSTTITARDVSQWLFRRRIAELLDFTGSAQADLAAIAEALVRHGYSRDDPNVLPHLLVTPTGITGARQYTADSGYILDALRELARTGVDWTVLGRRMLITGESPLARLPGLTDEDFAGPITVIEDGLAAATDAVVLGKGVRGHAGGEGACGLLEVLVTEEEILDERSAQAEAEAIVAAGDPSPLYVEVPDGTQLSPEAPVGINDLVPGVIASVASERTCRTVATDLRLLRVNVSFDQSSGERVGVTLAPVGIDSTN